MFGPRENVCWFRNSREWRIIHTSGMKRVAFSKNFELPSRL